MARPALVTAIALGAFLASCAPTPVKEPEAPAASLVWPRPPAPARVRFVRNVTGPADWGIARTGFSGFLDRLSGQRSFRFVRPTSVAVRGRTLYVADPGAQALVIFDAGEGREIELTHVEREALASPVAVALGPDDTVLVADSALRKVFVLDAQGRLRRTIGGEGRLGRPAGLAYDVKRDRLYVADSSAHRIVVYTAQGQFLGTFGSNGGAPGTFNYPTHLALTSDGDLLVTDTLNFRIQRLDPEGQPKGSVGHAGDGAGDFASPKGVAVDGEGNLYVVDALFDAVQIFSPDGTLMLGFGERGTRAGRFWLPNGIFIGGNTIYVADAYNQRIGVFERVSP